MKNNVNLNYPAAGDFTVKEVSQLNPNVSMANLQYSLRNDVQSGVLCVAGKRKGAVGRPLNVFNKVVLTAV